MVPEGWGDPDVSPETSAEPWDLMHFFWDFQQPWSISNWEWSKRWFKLIPCQFLLQLLAPKTAVFPLIPAFPKVLPKSLMQRVPR